MSEVKDEPLRIIFLDIDGVLVTLDSLGPGKQGSHSQAWPDCVTALNRIIESTGAQIVVSSTWRKCKNPRTTMAETLRGWGVNGIVIDTTPILYGDDFARGDEIRWWLSSYSRRPIEAFVILDDDKDMKELTPFLVQTEFRKGLTDAHADCAIQILTTRLNRE